MPLDVRRSARGAPPTTSAKPHPPASTASSSSLSSGRLDKSMKLATLAKSATPHSRSSEEMSEPPRRSQRVPQPKDEEALKDTIDADEDVGDDEEVTRCICGQQEYPGPPLSEAFTAAALESEDAGGLFISCDGCSVWQHGGCVGIIEENQVPDKYFCEECRPKLHDLHTDSRGQHYSLYQPVNGKTTRKSSVSKHGDKAQRERENTASRASADPSTGRRRATMRSKEHDDEEELLQRALEESRREVDATGTGRRNGKRTRDDSDDSKPDVKRQRRASELQPSQLRKADIASDSDDEPTTAAGRSKKARADAAQSARQAQLREKEKERESKRAEAADRRQERARQRRVDEEAGDETPRGINSARTSVPPSSQPGSPRAVDMPEKISHKKGAGKKTKKLGNNQYTKHTVASSPHGRKRNGHATSSGEENATNGDGLHHLPNGSNGGGKGSPDHTLGVGVKGKPGKGKHKAVNGNGASKHEEPVELTIPNMKRSIDAMAAYIAKAQVELAGTSANGANGAKTGDHKSSNLAEGAVQSPEVEGGGKAFEDMSAMEMADVVSKSINGWQSRFEHLA